MLLKQERPETDESVAFQNIPSNLYFSLRKLTFSQRAMVLPPPLLLTEMSAKNVSFFGRVPLDALLKSNILGWSRNFLSGTYIYIYFFRNKKTLETFIICLPFINHLLPWGLRMLINMGFKGTSHLSSSSAEKHTFRGILFSLQFQNSAETESFSF